MRTIKISTFVALMFASVAVSSAAFAATPLPSAQANHAYEESLRMNPDVR